jgi:hypothetical protein
MERTGKLPQQTPKARATRAEAQRACPLADYCVACGTSQQLTRSHILTVKMHPHQVANPLNVLTLCGFGANNCHELWENHKAEFARRFPHAYAEKLRRMALVDPAYVNFFLRKNPAPDMTANRHL